MDFEKNTLLELHKKLTETRMLEEKLAAIYAQGIVPGHIHSGIGQEATFVGVLAHRKDGDYFKLSHRPAAAYYLVGTDLDTFFGEILAKKTGNSGGRGGILHIGHLKDGVLGFSGTLGCDAAIPVGAAMTIEAEGRDNVAFLFIGDGASNRGPMYEAMVLASDWKLPVVFVCENNGFAISTPTEYSSAVPNVLADKAAGFAMPSVVCDGTDVLAVYEAAGKMIDYVRAGNGPAVIECKSYRWRGHFEGDQCAYRSAEVTKEHMENGDCIRKLETQLFADGVISQAEIDTVRAGFEAEMDAAIARAEAAPEMTADEIFDGLYV